MNQFDINIVCIRLWENKVTPWLDKHFGESD